ncbi:MerR family transcriptional regulator [Robertmurraya kyonggiensis]|uniref:MerR family transcriptional regulator n=1 Tax=Robertmurraya kyonggiensis TaxID=1037680 RepID=A0A4U1DA28_9BACI|nr:MerR family transcriptional regulator [Robertmurraya kyonggiensis]TKC19425.1 MerR family transcriptional regulator [Robertmurraya kyonggiensis]
MQNNKVMKAYSIKEVSKKVNIPTGTIRQWEKDLNGLLIIPRTKQGARFFTEHEIKLLLKIKEMREQNVSKEMIRTLLQKHFSEVSEPPSESFETLLPATQIETTSPTPAPVEDFQLLIHEYKKELVNEIKQEIIFSQQQIVEDLKNELSSSSLHSIKEISKSIQRANDKRKADLQDISGAILNVSEQTSESFDILADQVADSYDKISKKVTEATKSSNRESHSSLKRLTRNLTESKKDIERLVSALEDNQNSLLDTMHELKLSTEEIQHREEVFQGMLASYREAASAKAKKKSWWKIWK